MKAEHDKKKSQSFHSFLRAPHMKITFAAMLMALMVIGCDKSSPVDTAGLSDTQMEATYGELTMLKTTQTAGSIQIVTADTGICTHDSLRNMRMLDSLKAYLALTDEQFVSVKGFGVTLFTTLGEIRTQVISKGIKRDSAQVLVKAARDLFVASVKSVLTEAQITSFDTWLAKFWHKPLRGGRGHGGPGGRGGQGGRGGHGGHDDGPGHP